MRLYRYTVSGRGAFPIDMLRHDAAWPRTQDDVMLIVGSGPDAMSYQISLSSIQRPTAARWSSLGWRISAEATPVTV